jgi:hypothetical protein
VYASDSSRTTCQSASLAYGTIKTAREERSGAPLTVRQLRRRTIDKHDAHSRLAGDLAKEEGARHESPWGGILDE